MNEIDEINEKKYLNLVLDEIDTQTRQKGTQINDLEKEMRELTHYYSEEYYNIDEEERATGGVDLDDFETLINQGKQQYYRLKKQRLSPYFGKIDFCENGKDSNSYYIGIFNLTNGNDIPLICDWRAPVSNMYYDYELGEAQYKAPIGIIKGNITGKRQFKIKDSKMELCFDSNLTIQDEILQQELANNANQKMKNIVATLQREQNKIVRSENSTLFVQGVAGSGKTSIALHRVAYLLYKYRDKFKSSDILIMSPNSIFSEYISNVLPSLGEENILHTSFYKLASEELVALTPALQTREDALNELAENPARLNEIAYKNCFDFSESLKLYLKTYVNLSFNAKNLQFGDTKISKEEIEELYNKKYVQHNPAVRIGWIADYIVDKLDVAKNSQDLYDRIKKIIYPMFITNTLVDIYSDFLNKIGMEFSTINGKIRYEDIAGILYIKNYVLGLSKKSNIKYLVVDEMQDYSSIHFELFNSVYDCPKTVLGDIYQCLEKVIDEKDLPKYAEIVGANEILKLGKTYRSTYEIVEFADNIKKLHSEKVERHGDKPSVTIFKNIVDECKFITQLIKNNLNYESIAIICKTKKEAELYYSYLGELEDLSLVDEDSNMSKIMILPASLSKGLEFDMVILPNVSQQNYNNFLDKNLLYVSCTRALHKLFLTTTSSVCKFINQQTK